MKTISLLAVVLVAITIMPTTSKALKPTAVASTANIITGGGSLYFFTVRYSDDGVIIVGSLDSNDVRIMGPVGFNVAAAFVSVDSNTDGTPRTATYSIVPPGGFWESSDNGTYNVLMQENQVFDSLRNPVNSGTIGSFTVVAPAAPTGTLGNISTRLQVGTNDDVLIGGFIVGGSGPKPLLLRALGPTLTQFGVSDALPNPTLELRNSTGGLLVSNDNWGQAANAQSIPVSLRPPNALESAILTSLNPGSYTAIVRGINNSTGVALVEAYDIAPAATAHLINISTRGFVRIGDNVMIAGMIVQSNSQKVLVRALGPTLSAFGIINPLANPMLELRDSNASLLSANDNWKSTQQIEIAASGKAPPNDLESAIVSTLTPGNYTAIVGGANSTTGVALIEVYTLP